MLARVGACFCLSFSLWNCPVMKKTEKGFFLTGFVHILFSLGSIKVQVTIMKQRVAKRRKGTKRKRICYANVAKEKSIMADESLNTTVDSSKQGMYYPNKKSSLWSMKTNRFSSNQREFNPGHIIT